MKDGGIDRARRTAAILLAVGLVQGVVPARAAHESVALVAADVETTPVNRSGDSADDPAIWVNRANPAASTVIGNAKRDSLDVYNLAGTRIQRIAGAFGNVDVRHDFPLGAGLSDIAAVTSQGLKVFAINPATGLLSNVSAGGSIGGGGEGLCLYRSPVSGRFYVFQVTIRGFVRQTEIHDDDGDGRVAGRLVRSFHVGSESEGCVADDESGTLFISQEDVGLWRYGAEPGAGNGRTPVDRVGSGHLAADAEGLTILPTGPGRGFLIASAQNVSNPTANWYAVYQREAPHAFLGRFRITAGQRADGCSRTDGIDVTRSSLGAAFPAGMFVCQDNSNTGPGSTGNQNFKFTRLEKIPVLNGVVLPPPPTVSF